MAAIDPTARIEPGAVIGQDHVVNIGQKMGVCFQTLRQTLRGHFSLASVWRVKQRQHLALSFFGALTADFDIERDVVHCFIEQTAKRAAGGVVRSGE